MRGCILQQMCGWLGNGKQNQKRVGKGRREGNGVRQVELEGNNNRRGVSNVPGGGIRSTCLNGGQVGQIGMPT